jgi:hypothetical protein
LPISNRSSFFKALTDRCGPAEAHAAKAILDWAKQNMSRIEFGRGQRSGSFTPVFDQGSTAHYPIVCWTYGTVEVQFYWLSKPPFDLEDKRRELLNRLNQVPGIRLPATAIMRRPGIPLAVLAMPESVDLFLKVLDWFLAENTPQGWLKHNGIPVLTQPGKGDHCRLRTDQLSRSGGTE